MSRVLNCSALGQSALGQSVLGRSRRVTAAAAAAVTVAGTVTAVVLTAGVAGAVTNPAPAAGSRRSATRLSFPISATAGLSVDVGTGNGLITDHLLSLPGVTASVPIELWYNSSAYQSSVPSAVTGTTGSGGASPALTSAWSPTATAR